MGWQYLSPAQAAVGSYTKPIATISCSAQRQAHSISKTPNHTRRAFVRITLFPARMKHGCPWWTVGEFVRVALGQGEHRGKMMVERIPVKGNGFKLARHNSGKGGAVLYIADMLGMPNEGHKAQPIEVVQVVDNLVFTLPSWIKL